jgi:hypothetical protein
VGKKWVLLQGDWVRGFPILEAMKLLQGWEN